MLLLQAGTWVPWMDTMPEFKCDPDKPFAQIIVPTADTVRYTYLVDALLAAGKHVLCVGETGTGKTLSLTAKLLEGMPPEVQPLFMTFSARTSANQTQDIIGELGCTTCFVTNPACGKLVLSWIPH
jgi:dynein heavy chain